MVFGILYHTSTMIKYVVISGSFRKSWDMPIQQGVFTWKKCREGSWCLDVLMSWCLHVLMSRGVDVLLTCWLDVLMSWCLAIICLFCVRSWTTSGRSWKQKSLIYLDGGSTSYPLYRVDDIQHCFCTYKKIKSKNATWWGIKPKLKRRGAKRVLKPVPPRFLKLEAWEIHFIRMEKGFHNMFLK